MGRGVSPPRSPTKLSAVIQFVVFKREDKWVVKAKDQERLFSAEREAVNAAIQLANDSGKEGKPGAVLLQKSKAEFQKIWMYGESPYPPAKSDLRGTSGKRKRLAEIPA